MKVQPYLVSWPGRYADACAAMAQLERAFDRVVVVNSGERVEPGWEAVELGSDAYFTHQMLATIEHFLSNDAEVCLLLLADVWYDRFEELVADGLRMFERYRWGAYSPYVHPTAWPPSRVDLSFRRFAEGNLRLVSNPDLLLNFLHRDVLVEWRRRGVDRAFAENRFGWGLDLSLFAVSHSLGRPVIRDYAHLVNHREGTGYASEHADREMLDSIDAFDEATRSAVVSIWNEPDQLIRYYKRSRSGAPRSGGNTARE